MLLIFTKRQLEILTYIEEEHLPNLIEEQHKGGVHLNEKLIPDLVSRLEKMQQISKICTRILEKVPRKKAPPVRGPAHNPPPRIPLSLADVHTTPLPISAGGYTIFKWSMEKYKEPDAIKKVLVDLNLEVEDGWITCHDSLRKVVHQQLEKILINIGEDFFTELDFVVHGV